jgi:hypothetical protein
LEEGRRKNKQTTKRKKKKMKRKERLKWRFGIEQRNKLYLLVSLFGIRDIHVALSSKNIIE